MWLGLALLPRFYSKQRMVGHEAIGYIAQIGDGVGSLSVGQSVIIPSAADDGEIELAPTSQEFFRGLQDTWVP